MKCWGIDENLSLSKSGNVGRRNGISFKEHACISRPVNVYVEGQHTPSLVFSAPRTSKKIFEGTLYKLMMNEESVSVSLTPTLVRENLDALFSLSLA